MREGCSLKWVEVSGLGTCGGSLMRASLRQLTTGQMQTQKKTHCHHHKSKNDTRQPQNKPAWIIIKTNMQTDVVWLTLQLLSKYLSSTFLTVKAISGLVDTVGDHSLPWGLLGSSLKLSSDPIIQLAAKVERLGGDDGWNTCRGWAWCGAQGPRWPDQQAVFELMVATYKLSRRNGDT